MYKICILPVSFLLLATAFAQRPEQALLNADRNFAKATAEKRLEGWMSFFGEDAVVLRKQPIVGIRGIRDFYQQVFGDPDFKLEWEPARGEIFPSGDLGYTAGKFLATYKTEKGEIGRQRGTYITIWKKQADGSWKVAADGGTPDEQPTPTK
ncbi:MAG TPA: DUF4440 domain-containing protein [Terriglobales bacterium]|nr:DUF4440 domain-containing protein [Terriglobales bacterium]